MVHRVACVALVLVGCVDARPRSESRPPRPGLASAVPTTPTEQLVPIACDRFAWSAIAAPKGPVELAVAAGPMGATIFAAPSSGGDIAAFVVDPKGDVMTPSQVVRTNATYVATGATFVDDHVIASAIDTAGNLYIDDVARDLSASTQIAKVSAAFGSKRPMLNVWDTPTAPTLGARELDVTTFDTSFATPQTTAIEATRQPIAVDAAQLALDGVVGWSTTTDCHLDVLAARGAVMSASQPFPCPSIRVATDAAAYTTVAVYETAGGVEFFGAWFANLQPLQRMLAPGATSPRIAYDGAHYWIAYIDASGELAAGLLTSSGTAVVVGLGTLPSRDAFELGIVGGEPWVFIADTAGFHGQRMCVGAVPST